MSQMFDVVSFRFLYYLGKHYTHLSSSCFRINSHFEFIHTCTSHFCVHSLYAVFTLCIAFADRSGLGPTSLLAAISKIVFSCPAEVNH